MSHVHFFSTNLDSVTYRILHAFAFSSLFYYFYLYRVILIYRFIISLF